MQDGFIRGHSCPKQPCKRQAAGAGGELAEAADRHWAAWQLAMAVHSRADLYRFWQLLLTEGLQC